MAMDMFSKVCNHPFQARPAPGDGVPPGMWPGGRDVQKVRIGYASPGGGSIPVWVAYEAGAFAALGIEADLQLHEGSMNVIGRVAGGSLDFANLAATAVVQATLGGQGHIRMLTGGVTYLAQMLIARPGFDATADLEGARFGARTGTAGVVTGLDFWLYEQVLPRLGLNVPPRSQMVPVGGSHADAIRALLAGTADAILLVPPYAFEAERQGLRILVDGFDLAISYQLGGLVAAETTIAADPDLVARMVEGYVAGIRRFHADPDLVVACLRKYADVTDEGIARATAACFARYFRPVPYPSPEGMQAILDQSAGAGYFTDGWSAADFIDDRFVARLDPARAATGREAAS